MTWQSYRPLFKAYDIRGKSVLFDTPFVLRLAGAFTKLYQEHGATKLVLGYDARPKSRELALTFLSVLETAGIKVLWLGLVSTPMMAYFVHTHADGNGIIMTASHSPKDILGLKWLIDGNSSNQAQIEALFDRLSDDDLTPLTPLSFGSTDKNPISTQPYCDTLIHIIRALSNTQAPFIGKVGVIDCLNGATSCVAKQIFASLGGTWIMLNNNPDGNFPKGNPDPAEPNRLTELQTAVLQHQADIGLAFDGDGDRLAVVDDKGRVVDFDWLIWLLAQASQTTPAPVIFDIKCSHALNRLLRAHQMTPIMVKTGSSHLRRLLQGEHQTASFAGELSGHFIFNDGRFVCHDDGIYAGLRLLHYLGNTKLSSLIDDLPKLIISPDLYINAPDNYTPQAFILALQTQLANNPQMAAPITIDGIRLETDVSFIIIRASNTSSQLTLRMGADSEDIFDKVLMEFCQIIAKINPNFAKVVYNTLYQSIT